jgi:hypothetical protein
MTYFLQVPPTGVHPHTVIADTDMCWIYRVDLQPPEWRPVTDLGWFRHWGGYGTGEGIPDVMIETWNNRPPVQVVLQSLMSDRPKEGAFGVWCRSISQLPSKNGPVLYTGIFGLIWHPNPEAFAHCKAQEQGADLVAYQAARFNESGRDLRWARYEKFEELWAAVPRIP